jgi:hypothetical protein
MSMPALPVVVPTVKFTVTIAECPTVICREDGDAEHDDTNDGLTQDTEKLTGPGPSLLTVKLAEALPPGTTVLLTPHGETLATVFEQGSVIGVPAGSTTPSAAVAARAGAPLSMSNVGTRTANMETACAVLDALMAQCNVARIRVAPVKVATRGKAQDVP